MILVVVDEFCDVVDILLVLNLLKIIVNFSLAEIPVTDFFKVMRVQSTVQTVNLAHALDMRSADVLYLE